MSASLWYKNPAAAIDWLCKAFGFEVRLKVEGEGGRIEHSELVFGDAVLMVGSEGPSPEKERDTSWQAAPRSVGGKNTANLFLYVDDVDAHCERARAAGATIANEPKTTDYGAEYWSDRNYEAIDPEGHHFWFAQRMRSKQ
jgi:uncharacterized glyoxalase superfamily protein PhnB